MNPGDPERRQGPDHIQERERAEECRERRSRSASSATTQRRQPINGALSTRMGIAMASIPPTLRMAVRNITTSPAKTRGLTLTHRRGRRTWIARSNDDEIASTQRTSR